MRHTEIVYTDNTSFWRGGGIYFGNPVCTCDIIARHRGIAPGRYPQERLERRHWWSGKQWCVYHLNGCHAVPHKTITGITRY